MSEENLEIVRGVFESFQAAVENGDFRRPDAIEAGLLDADFVFVPSPDLPTAESYRGLDGFARFIETWIEDFDRWSIELERLVDAGDDRVVAIARQEATGKGSGAPVALEFGLLYELEAGRVIRIRNFVDPAHALEAAGLRE
jgi:ketosteroid isomerase-like protein